jgi:L-fuculose-phosphate aldolase
VRNTLGTIAVRIGSLAHSDGVIYTKRQGVSLEEMSADDVAVTDAAGKLLHGAIGPSIGHKLNRAIFTSRRDINAVIHVHPVDVIAYGCAHRDRDGHLPLLSADAPLVLGKPVLILDRGVNVETDAELVPTFISETNCFIMPNHGVTALGYDVSEAYHRLCTCVDEVATIMRSQLYAQALGNRVSCLSQKEIQELYKSGFSVLYGGVRKS